MSPRPSSRRPAGTAAAVAAAVTGLIAFALVVAGGLALWANGHFKDDEGYVGTGSHHFTSRDYAITAGDIDLSGTGWTHGRWGTLRLRVSSGDGAPVFVGVAPTRQVDAYLRDVAHSEVVDVGATRYRHHAGTERPGAPAAQRFWEASARGSGRQTLRWHARSGHWSVVVMNADGTRGVTTRVSAATRLPFLTALAWGTLGAALVFVLVTGGLML